MSNKELIIKIFSNCKIDVHELDNINKSYLNKELQEKFGKKSVLNAGTNQDNIYYLGISNSVIRMGTSEEGYSTIDNDRTKLTLKNYYILRDLSDDKITLEECYNKLKYG